MFPILVAFFALQMFTSLLFTFSVVLHPFSETEGFSEITYFLTIVRAVALGACLLLFLGFGTYVCLHSQTVKGLIFIFCAVGQYSLEKIQARGKTEVVFSVVHMFGYDLVYNVILLIPIVFYLHS